ncbi:MAG: 50S ribosomal protein L4 [Bacilli bacterium]|nr:50S ribosomal protein L4 [Bacilli bacterium]
MKKVDIFNLKGEKINDEKLNENIFGVTPNDKVLYDAIILGRASLRQGTHSTKTRSEVRGGGRKPWRQKGTGHARQGSIRSVQWVGGGRYGTPVPRDYSKKMNRKERGIAIKSAYSYKAMEDAIVILEDLVLETPKTKDFVKVLDLLKLTDKKVLLVVKDLDENVILATRNLSNILLVTPKEISVLDLVGSDYLVVTKDALKQIEEVLL